MTTYDLYAIGNALVDSEYEVSDELLKTAGVEKRSSPWPSWVAKRFTLVAWRMMIWVIFTAKIWWPTVSPRI